MNCCSESKVAIVEPKPEPKPTEIPSKPTSPSPSPEPKPIPVSGVPYKIKVKTGNQVNSSTSGPAFIRIFGHDDRKTEEIELKTSDNQRFDTDSLETIEIRTEDIGKPHRIIIRHEDVTSGWYIEYIIIEVHSYSIRFPVHRWLNKTKHDGKLDTEIFESDQPDAVYTIEIETGSQQNESNDSPVYVEIHGTSSKTPKIFLDPVDVGFAKNAISKFQVESIQVGKIEKIIVGHEGTGKIKDWHLKNFKIETENQKLDFRPNVLLGLGQDDKRLFIELNADEIRPLSPLKFMYLVKIKTIKLETNDTFDNVQLSIKGSNGQIDKVFLKTCVKTKEEKLFQNDCINEFDIEYNDIGSIKYIIIGFDDDQQTSSWLFEYVEIKHKEQIYYFHGQYWLSSRLGPDFSWIKLKSKTNDNNTEYKLFVETGQSETDADVMLCIYGDKHTTKCLPLRTTSNGQTAEFHVNSKLEFLLKTINVGNINKINIGYNKTNNKKQWFLKSVRIEKNDESYIFNVNRHLGGDEASYIDLYPEESRSSSPEDRINYIITVVTSSSVESSTDSGVFLTIYGDKSQTEQFELINTRDDSKALFQEGQIDQFAFDLKDVGNIQKINIGHDGKGLRPSWHLDRVEIKTETDIYKFYANQILDLSKQYIDLIPNQLPSSKNSRRPSSNNSLDLQTQEINYGIKVEYGAYSCSDSDDDDSLHMVICGILGKTKKIPLKKSKNSDEIEIRAANVGEITKIVLMKEGGNTKSAPYIRKIRIKQGQQYKEFHVNRKLDKNCEYEIKPSPIDSPSDIDYRIKTTTGEKSFKGEVTAKIRGEYGIINIPLSKTIDDKEPFQSKATNEFSHRTNDVGKIKQVTILVKSTESDATWFLKKIQIIRGNQIYHFLAGVRFDSKVRRVNLYPVTSKQEDYVQTELRRLRANLRCESAKIRMPPHKPHEPFIHNNLRPYFDTSGVEKAINEPSDKIPGYYTRLTALRIVEPWESHGMDYGVSYEFSKERRARVYSGKRSKATQNGMMIIPPLSLPFGGQITYVNPAKFDDSRLSSAKTGRSLSARNTERNQTAKLMT